MEQQKVYFREAAGDMQELFSPSLQMSALRRKEGKLSYVGN